MRTPNARTSPEGWLDAGQRCDMPLLELLERDRRTATRSSGAPQTKPVREAVHVLLPVLQCPSTAAASSGSLKGLICPSRKLAW